MTLEALLAYAHILAFLAFTVFLSSEAAVCRMEWMNEAVVRRLVRLDLIYQLSLAAVLLSGLARTLWGIKGSGWYWSQPLLHLKLTLFVVIVGLSVQPTRLFWRWRRNLAAGGGLPPAHEVQRARRLAMLQAHLMPLIPLAAVFLARGLSF